MAVAQVLILTALSVIGCVGRGVPLIKTENSLFNTKGEILKLIDQIPQLIKQLGPKTCPDEETYKEIHASLDATLISVEVFRESFDLLDKAIASFASYVRTSACSNTSTPLGCNEDEYECLPGNCINKDLVCDGFMDCPNGTDEQNCQQTTCKTEEFRCGDGACISQTWKCDSEQDCQDGSDEENCPDTTCKTEEFQCDDGKCISQNWKCDSDQDCQDGSDEKNCTGLITCSEDQFSCSDGHCIYKSWKCDGDQDCPDGSDEEDCPKNTCPSTKFQCQDSSSCIHLTWRCDGENDCADGSDEQGCLSSSPSITTSSTMSTSTSSSSSSTTSELPPCQDDYSFRCQSSSRCVPFYYTCDGEDDCGDNSDEESCWDYSSSSTVVSSTSSSSTTEQVYCGQNEFQCLSGNGCIRRWYMCDGDLDCDDGSDEEGCQSSTSSSTTTYSTTEFTCPEHEFQCRVSDVCIPKWKRCDGIRDCPDDSDEVNCFTSTSSTEAPLTTPGPAQCEEGEGICKSTQSCIPGHWLCDGVYDCEDRSDEENCQSSSSTSSVPSSSPPVTTPFSGSYEVTCGDKMFPCAYGGLCIPNAWKCDGVPDCADSSDEVECPRKTSCDSDQFLCQKEEICIPASLTCDGLPDCIDESDESDCQELSACVGNSCSHGCQEDTSSPTGYICTCPPGEGLLLAKDGRNCIDPFVVGPAKGGLAWLKGSSKGK